MAASEATDQPLGCRVSFGEGQGSLVDGKLLAKGEVLEGELTVTAEEEGEEPEQLEQQGDHRAAIVAGPGPTDQSLGCRTRFWRSTGLRGSRVVDLRHESQLNWPARGSDSSARAPSPTRAYGRTSILVHLME